MRNWTRRVPLLGGLCSTVTGRPAGHGAFRAASHRALARRHGHTAILRIGLNSLGEINDTLGRRAGDRALDMLAEILRRCVDPPGTPYRLGGDEFAVVLPGVGHPEDAYEVAGRIAAALGPVVIGGHLVTLMAGIGVAVAAPGVTGHDELVDRAGEAMRRARSLGPDTRWAIWPEPPSPTLRAA